MTKPKLYKPEQLIPSEFLKYTNFKDHPIYAVPGVYFLCRAETVVCVGASPNVERAVRCHPRCRPGREYDNVKWTQVPEILVPKVAQYWVWKLHPKYNRPIQEEPRFTLSRRRTTRRCSYCGAKFPKTNPKVRYCSTACMIEGLLKPGSPPYDPKCVFQNTP